MDIDSKNFTIHYPEEVKSLEIPSLNDNEKVSFRLQIILSYLGEEIFNEVNTLLHSKKFESKNINFESLKITEFEIWLSYLSLVSNIMGRSVKETQFHSKTKDIFPLKNILSEEELAIGKRDRYPYIKNLYISDNITFFIRSKLAIYELLYAKFQLKEHWEQLSYFSSDYSHSKDEIQCPKEDKFSDHYMSRTMLLNYFQLHNEIRDLGVSEFNDKYGLSKYTESSLLQPRESVLEVLFMKGQISDIGLRAFEKKLKYLCTLYNIERFAGRPTAEYEFGELLPPTLTGYYSHGDLRINYCLEFNKFQLIKQREDYKSVFDYLETEFYCSEDDFKLYYDNILKYYI